MMIICDLIRQYDKITTHLATIIQHHSRFLQKSGKKNLAMDKGRQDFVSWRQSKTEFHDELDPKLLKKCRFVNTVSLSTPTTDIHKKLLTHLYAYRKARVTRMLEEFEHKVKEGKTARRNSVIKKALAVGAVGTLYVSAQYRSNPKHLEIMRMLEMAENTSAGIEFVSAPNLVKKLDINDSVLAVLRYKIK